MSFIYLCSPIFYKHLCMFLIFTFVSKSEKLPVRICSKPVLKVEQIINFQKKKTGTIHIAHTHYMISSDIFIYFDPLKKTCKFSTIFSLLHRFIKDVQFLVFRLIVKIVVIYIPSSLSYPMSCQ